MSAAAYIIHEVGMSGKSIFNTVMEAHSKDKFVEHGYSNIIVSTLGSTTQDRMELLKLIEASEENLGTSVIRDWLSPEFFTSKFWYMWQTTFTFEPWHSAAKFKRYLHRFIDDSSED